MKTGKIGIGVMTWVGLLFLFSCQHTTEEKSESGNVESKVSVTETEPDDDLEKALEAFADKQYDESDHHIRKAAKSMESVAAIATGESKQKIENSIAELNDLAERVSRDHVDGLNELNYFFARAGNALAGYKVTITETDFNKHSPKETAMAFRELIGQLKNNEKYFSREIRPEETKVLEDAKVLADKIEKSEKVTDDEISQNLNDLKVQLKKWEEEFSTRKK
jgi:hypothetical protein